MMTDVNHHRQINDITKDSPAIITQKLVFRRGAKAQPPDWMSKHTWLKEEQPEQHTE